MGNRFHLLLLFLPQSTTLAWPIVVEVPNFGQIRGDVQASRIHNLRFIMGGAEVRLDTSGMYEYGDGRGVSERFRIFCSVGGHCTIRATFGDAAASYAAEWIVVDGMARRTVLTSTMDVGTAFRDRLPTTPVVLDFDVPPRRSGREWRTAIEPRLQARFRAGTDSIRVRYMEHDFTLDAAGIPMVSARSQAFTGFCYDAQQCWFRGRFTYAGKTVVAEWSVIDGVPERTILSAQPDLVRLFRTDLMPPRYQ